MDLLTEQQQIDVLRDKCENVTNRIWIASPYIGGLKDVQKIIGGKWQFPSIDCRILTDIDSGFIRNDTFDEFMNNQVEVKSLDSLHAKIYIVDDWCLVTSANLTGTAFFCRYEMGISSMDVTEVEKTYQRWWGMASVITKLNKKNKKALVDYQDGNSFKKKFKAKPYVSGKQDKYDAVCEKYIDFAKLYEKVTGRNPQMVADGFTLLQEVDYLFNYLYHYHPQTPSKGQTLARTLSAVQKENTIRKYYKGMCDYYKNDPQHWRLKRTKIIQKLLNPKAINNLGWKEAKEVAMCLHCLASYSINRTKFLNPQNDNIDDIRDCWNQLLHTGKIDSYKIKYVTSKLKNFKFSSIYELIGWYYPDRYPLMNGNSDCGMRFFGYNI